MNVSKTYKKPKQFLAITSLKPEEFDLLLEPFTRHWRKWYKHYDFRNNRRSKPLSATVVQNPTKTLPREKDKLFFILYILKNNPLQATAAAVYGMDQGQVSKWIRILSPILEAAIKDLGFEPARNAEQLAARFRDYEAPNPDLPVEEDKIQTLNLDATERPIGRNTDASTQRQDYSGKQKQHTVKNSIISDEYRYIHFLGPSWRGAIHDKTMAENELPHFKMGNFKGLWLAKDTGYQGYCPKNIILLEPSKKPPKKERTEAQKQVNAWVSSIRTVVEHAIGGLKRLRIVSEKWRYQTNQQLDRVMNIAAGLHNLRVALRRTSYRGTTQRTTERLNIFRS